MFILLLQLSAVEAVDYINHICGQVFNCFFYHPVGYAVVGGSNASRHTGDCVAVAAQ